MSNEVDFGFARLEIEHRTAEYPISQLHPGGVLIVQSATTSNTAYQEALIAWNARQPRRDGEVGESKEVDQNRGRDREVYPGSVVVGWKKIWNKAADKEAEYSLELCKQFMLQIPNYMFDELRLFCIAPENFVERDLGLGEVNVEDLAKN